MKQVLSDIIQFRGTHYDFGVYQGELLKKSPLLANRKKQWKKRSSRHFLVDEAEIRAIFQTFSPAIWEELEGLADALEMNMSEALQEFGGYYFEYGKSGCSILMGDGFMIRNYDNDPVTYEGRYVLYEPKDSGYASIGPSMQITGRTDGLNEKGLAMGYNFVNRLRGDDGFVCNMIGRLVLENCATLEEGVELLKEIPHRFSFTYPLTDRSGKTVVVEASAQEVVAREGSVCTNHFEKLTKDNRYRMDDSLRRYENMTTAKPSIEHAYDAFRVLNETEQGVFSNNYGAWAGTIHTAAYLPKQMQAWMALGADRLPLILDFGKWLSGTDLHATQIKGELQSANGFINH